jgi:catechol 2,3-dioxygenase-like lactoylglutathione lyase family enzyme
MLGPIRAVTTTASDLKAVEDAYQANLGYKTVEKTVVSDTTAASWGAPAVAGAKMLIMMPESGEPTYLRFVEQALPAGYKPLTTFGWNSTEIVVQNSDELYEKLKGTAFNITFPPHDLDGLPDIRAMQGYGPAGEMLYLTWIKRPVAGYDLPVAKSFVDRCFITVLGGPDMEAMRSFYRDVFGRQSRPVRETMALVLSEANGLPPDWKHPLSTVGLSDGTLIELDQYPVKATVRPKPPGGLPAGMAIVTFEYGNLDPLSPHFIAPPHATAIAPFKDHRTATMIGAAGELIELVEV